MTDIDLAGDAITDETVMRELIGNLSENAQRSRGFRMPFWVTEEQFSAPPSINTWINDMAASWQNAGFIHLERVAGNDDGWAEWELWRRSLTRTFDLSPTWPGGSSAETEQPRPADLFDRIDRAIDGLCPCGAEPIPEFDPYCSYDCRPGHRAADTTSDRDGTQMRWRPDLVSEVDDSGLRVRAQRRRYGRWWIEVFDRVGTDGVLHVRVDDGNRWVGADLALRPEDSFDERYAAKLRALVAELEDDRCLVPPTSTPHRFLTDPLLWTVDSFLWTTNLTIT